MVVQNRIVNENKLIKRMLYNFVTKKECYSMSFSIGPRVCSNKHQKHYTNMSSPTCQRCCGKHIYWNFDHGNHFNFICFWRVYADYFTIDVPIHTLLHNWWPCTRGIHELGTHQCSFDLISVELCTISLPYGIEKRRGCSVHTLACQITMIPWCDILAISFPGSEYSGHITYPY